MKRVRRLICVLLVLVMLGCIVNPAMAVEYKLNQSTMSNVTKIDRKVEPMAINNGHLEFNPSTTSTNKWVYLKGWLDYYPIVGISYESYDELVDGRLTKPLVTSTNLPNLTLEYKQFNKDLGGPAWHFHSSFWVIGFNIGVTHRYLNVITKANATGTYKALLGGGPGYIPYPYLWSANLYVN